MDIASGVAQIAGAPFSAASKLYGGVVSKGTGGIIPPEEAEISLLGLGARGGVSPVAGPRIPAVKRKEDPRFIRGQGRYVDDIVLPGMLYLDIVRSPFAHARIKSIDTDKALKVPGVRGMLSPRSPSSVSK